MTHRIQIPTRGYLPQDPYIPSHLKIASSRHRQISKAKTVAGSTLLLIGLIAFATCLASVQKTNDIYNNSLSLNSNQKNETLGVSIDYNISNSYDKQPTIEGRIVVVRGENVEFTVISTERINKTYTFLGKTVNCTVASQDPKDIRQVISTTVNGAYSFSLPANGDYEVIIQNSGSQLATVNFELKIIATYTAILIIGMAILLAAALPGTVLIVKGLKGKKVTVPMPLN